MLLPDIMIVGVGCNPMSIRNSCASLLITCAIAACLSAAYGEEKTLYRFHGGNDGAGPNGVLIPDGSNKLLLI